MNQRTLTMVSRWAQAVVGVLLLLMLAAGTGCSRRKPGTPPGLAGVIVPAPLQPIMDRMHYDGQRSWVLHLNTLAVEALRQGDRDLAKRALDEGIIEINAVFGDSAEARRARSLFFQENSKLFKGEAYERCMAFLYRGLLYMQDGDWDNARACFRSGIFNDEFAEEDSKRADWVAFYWLKAICEERLRTGYTEQDFAAAMKLVGENAEIGATVPGSIAERQSAPLPMPKSTDNLLVVVFTGSAPRKVLAGRYGEAIKFQQGRAGGFAAIQVDSAPGIPITFLDSVFYQATTRGGRPVDRLNRKKAAFKGATQSIGNVALTSGYVVGITSNDSKANVAAVGLAAVGLVALGISALTSPKADDRAWLNIGDKIYAWTGSVPEGQRYLRVTESTGRTAELNVVVPAPGAGMQTVLVQFDAGIPVVSIR